MEYNYLEFDIGVGKTKPETIINKDEKCPFCDYSTLEGIIEREDDILLMENKYQVLKNAYQLLVIEGQTCDIDIPEYSKQHMCKVIRFAIKHWLELIESRRYHTVLLFKNYGPLSGGTMRHPHMQIIGLKNEYLSIKNMYEIEQFYGIDIAAEQSVSINLSTRPRVGFTELNVIMQNLRDIDILADYLQRAVSFIVREYQRSSYNLFFYYINKCVYIKIIPRFATSPLFIGYNIELVPDNLAATAELLTAKYFPDKKKL